MSSNKSKGRSQGSRRPAQANEVQQTPGKIDSHIVPTLSSGRAKGTSNNWQVFREKMNNYLSSEFGSRGTFINNDGRPKNHPRPRHPRWLRMTDEEVEAAGEDYYELDVQTALDLGLPEPAVYRDQNEAKHAFAKKVSAYEDLIVYKYRDIDIRMHAVLWAHTSLESREFIERLDEYEERSLRGNDPYWLFKAMEMTHYLQPTGQTIADKEKLRREWFAFRMRDNEVSELGACKKRYTDLLRRVEACGIDGIPGEEDRVAYFVINSLHTQFAKYRERYERERESSHLSGELPTTIAKLFERLGQETTIKSDQAGRIVSVVPIAQSFMATKKKGKNSGKSKSSDSEKSDATAGGKTSKYPPKRPCKYCSMMGVGDNLLHWESECENKAACEAIVAKALDEDPESAKTSTGKSKAHFATKKSAVSFAGAEKVTEAKSHFTLAAHYHFDDDFDIEYEAAPDEAVCSISLTNSVSQTIEPDPDDITPEEFRALVNKHSGELGPDDVVNDNGSQVNIFHNRSLLTNLRSCRPLKVSGVTGGVKTSTCGDFHGLKVYYVPTSPANLLAQRDLEDKCDLDYSKIHKAYRVRVPHGPEWIFRRPDDLGGLRVCNMRTADKDALEFTSMIEANDVQVFIQTVDDNT